MKILLMLMVVLLAGCTGYGNLLKQLKDDPAIVVIRMGTPWGNQVLTRVGGQTNSVIAAPDGTVTVNPK